ncbi:FtsQ-type POTRA domain-containing protein [bacterium]|nr:FtsQ-type POTRA domain-containing protein [bacterium]
MAQRRSDEKSRAEKVRARRQKSPRQKSRQQSQSQPFGNNASRKQPSNRAPVTRRTNVSTPMVKRTMSGNKVRVPLKAKGAELQLPALPKIKLGWRLISGAVFALSLAVVITFSSLSTFKVSAINLEGADRLTAEAITSQLGITGTSIIKIKPDEIETQISERFPSVNSVSVAAGLPSSVTVKVTERQPLIAWQQDGSTLWIDADGVMFVPRGEAEVPLTIAAAGDPPAAISIAPETAEDLAEASEEEREAAAPAMPRTTPEFVEGVLSLTGYLPEGSALQYDPQFGLGWRDPAGWLVYFGKDISNIDLKLAEYQTILAELSEQNLTPSLISLEFLYAPFYRLEQ